MIESSEYLDDLSLIWFYFIFVIVDRKGNFRTNAVHRLARLQLQ